MKALGANPLSVIRSLGRDAVGGCRTVLRRSDTRQPWCTKVGRKNQPQRCSATRKLWSQPP